MTKSLILATNVTFPADRLGISNHTCEPTVKKNLLRAINVTISASDLSNSNYTCESTIHLACIDQCDVLKCKQSEHLKKKKTQDKEACCKNIEVKVI